MKKLRKSVKPTGKRYNSVEELIKDMKNTPPEVFEQLKKQRELAERYPILAELDIPITLEPVLHIKFKDLKDGLKRNKINTKLFNKYFGVQTMFEQGPYPWDVSDVLIRILENKLVGTQLFPD
jgi:hypothetical protein